MEPNTQSNRPEGYGQNEGYPRQTTQQEMLSQPKRMTGNYPDEINPNSPQTGNNPNEINPNTPQTGNNPNEMNPNTPQRENIPNEINPNTPQTGNNPNEINPNSPQTGNDPGEITPNNPPTNSGYTDNSREGLDVQIPNTTEGKKEGYAETPSDEYVPEINNSNDKYQPNYQDSEAPPAVTE